MSFYKRVFASFLSMLSLDAAQYSFMELPNLQPNNNIIKLDCEHDLTLLQGNSFDLSYDRSILDMNIYNHKMSLVDIGLKELRLQSDLNLESFGENKSVFRLQNMSLNNNDIVFYNMKLQIANTLNSGGSRISFLKSDVSQSDLYADTIIAKDVLFDDCKIETDEINLEGVAINNGSIYSDNLVAKDIMATGVVLNAEHIKIYDSSLINMSNLPYPYDTSTSRTEDVLIMNSSISQMSLYSRDRIFLKYNNISDGGRLFLSMKQLYLENIISDTSNAIPVLTLHAPVFLEPIDVYCMSNTLCGFYFKECNDVRFINHGSWSLECGLLQSDRSVALVYRGFNTLSLNNVNIQYQSSILFDGAGDLSLSIGGVTDNIQNITWGFIGYSTVDIKMMSDMVMKLSHYESSMMFHGNNNNLTIYDSHSYDIDKMKGFNILTFNRSSITLSKLSTVNHLVLNSANLCIKEYMKKVHKVSFFQASDKLTIKQNSSSFWSSEDYYIKEINLDIHSADQDSCFLDITTDINLLINVFVTQNNLPNFTLLKTGNMDKVSVKLDERNSNYSIHAEDDIVRVVNGSLSLSGPLYPIYPETVAMNTETQPLNLETQPYNNVILDSSPKVTTEALLNDISMLSNIDAEENQKEVMYVEKEKIVTQYVEKDSSTSGDEHSYVIYNMLIKKYNYNRIGFFGKILSPDKSCESGGVVNTKYGSILGCYNFTTGNSSCVIDVFCKYRSFIPNLGILWYKPEYITDVKYAKGSICWNINYVLDNIEVGGIYNHSSDPKSWCGILMGEFVLPKYKTHVNIGLFHYPTVSLLFDGFKIWKINFEVGVIVSYNKSSTKHNGFVIIPKISSKYCF